MHVAHLETGTFAGKTAGAKGAHTALVGYFGQRVGLVHELRQSIGAEERVDNARDGLGVNKVESGELFAVADVHSLADSAGHARKTYTELVVELLADSAYAAVAQVVDVVDIGTGVDKLDEVADNGDDVLAGEHTHVHIGCQIKLAVDAVAAHFAEVVALLGEEQVVDNLSGTCIVRRLRVAQLPVDVLDGFLLGVGAILLKGVEDYGVVAGVGILFVEQNGIHVGIQNLLDMLFGEFGLAVDNHLVALDCHNFTGILVHKVLGPCLEHTCCQLATDCFLEISLVDLDFLGKSENFDDVLVAFQTDGTQQSSYGQLLLTVDVGIHHVVDVGCELDPASAEGDDTRRIQLCTVCMGALSEEHTGRTVQLTHNNTFGTVDDKGAFFGHIWNLTQVYRLDIRVEALVVGVGAAEL